MIEALWFSDKQVARRLLDRVAKEEGLVLVTAVQHRAEAGALEHLEPFATLEDVAGKLLLQLLVVDDGSPAGMWRDPMGHLAEHYFEDERAKAYVAATGYLLLSKGQIAQVLKKSGSPRDDAWYLQEALARVHKRIPSPNPSDRPQAKGTAKQKPARVRSFDELKASAMAPLDPWKLLGISRGTPLGQARAAFRALIVQYHPDKVAHLGPEFRELAELKTRQLTEAWEFVQRELGGG